jgi:hypothetical protein
MGMTRKVRKASLNETRKKMFGGDVTTRMGLKMKTLKETAEKSKKSKRKSCNENN